MCILGKDVKQMKHLTKRTASNRHGPNVHVHLLFQIDFKPEVAIPV